MKPCIKCTKETPSLTHIRSRTYVSICKPCRDTISSDKDVLEANLKKARDYALDQSEKPTEIQAILKNQVIKQSPFNVVQYYKAKKDIKALSDEEIAEEFVKYKESLEKKNADKSL